MAPMQSGEVEQVWAKMVNGTRSIYFGGNEKAPGKELDFVGHSHQNKLPYHSWVTDLKLIKTDVDEWLYILTQLSVKG